MTDSPTSQAMHLAMTELKERAERVAELEEALQWMVDTFGDRNRLPKVIEAAVAIHKARSVLSKETNRG